MSTETALASRPPASVEGEATVTTRQPIAPPGFHWHGYISKASALLIPTAEDRAARLATVPAVLLGAPYAVSGWLGLQIQGYGGRFALWAPDLHRWEDLPTGDPARLRMEFLLAAARAESVYVSVSADPLPEVRLVFAEAVSDATCSEHRGQFSTSLDEHYGRAR
ncbi:hypothetical protein [Amycolatopsis keratiniphila]|uniref:Uncharacterized protein n=1 Tax=Amycolatopsis keratiniphila subsp. keratiniphila TaxID=227715 RepID=A0A1W2M219_9PSEU|nr:hypothetical protein [Amycolatopsis keratiniphila]ONF73955.1 hypothetical protein AVR91_0204290 [Amycolatopsis keratiniphila subsp. keratiniphila]